MDIQHDSNMDIPCKTAISWLCLIPVRATEDRGASLFDDLHFGGLVSRYMGYNWYHYVPLTSPLSWIAGTPHLIYPLQLCLHYPLIPGFLGPQGFSETVANLFGCCHPINPPLEEQTPGEINAKVFFGHGPLEQLEVFGDGELTIFPGDAQHGRPSTPFYYVTLMMLRKHAVHL